MRFPEFSGEWVETELQDIVPNICSGKDRISNSGEVALYGSTGVIGRTNSASYKENIVLVARVGANAGQMQIGNAPCGVTDNTLVIDAKEWNYYIYYFLQHYNLNRLVFGSGQPLITGGMLKRIKVRYGCKAERNNITRLLCLIDERIATQNKIIEDLKKLKCAIIEKVLNGNNANNLRLGDVGSYIRGLTYSSDDVVEYNSTLVMRSNNIVNGSLLDYQNNVVSVNKQISQEQQLQDGDIIICMANGSSALVGKSSFYDGKCISPITVGAFCGIYRSKTAITKWLFQTNRYRRYIWNSLQGGNGAIANLNSEDILRMSFPLPDKQTAERCIKLLSSLESLIESNISLCSKFFQQKEYLLRQMFI